jgi:hypothetical protein
MFEQIIGQQARRGRHLLLQRRPGPRRPAGRHARLGVAVPQQVAVAGFNDLTGSDQMLPPLTTVRTPRAEMGAAAARMLMLLAADGLCWWWQHLSRRVSPRCSARLSPLPHRHRQRHEMQASVMDTPGNSLCPGARPSAKVAGPGLRTGVARQHAEPPAFQSTRASPPAAHRPAARPQPSGAPRNPAPGHGRGWNRAQRRPPAGRPAPSTPGRWLRGCAPPGPAWLRSRATFPSAGRA